MRISSIASIFTLAGYATAAPASPFPLPDGFPMPSQAQLAEIASVAGGSLPNGPLPTKLTPTGLVTIQLIALNELFEVAYFTELLHNITTNVPGYDVSKYNATYVTETIKAIINQEELHALGANGILKSAKQTPFTPCQYKAPVSDFLSAITLAQTFTDVVLGVLPMAQTVFATDGGDETPLVNLIGSILGQEAEQVGWFRSVQKKIPSAAPFLTTEGPAFAYTFLQSVILPGSCPAELATVSKSIPTFKPLTVITKNLTAKNATISYSVPGPFSASDNSVVYLSGQNLPVTVPISSTDVRSKDDGSVSYFSASLPFQSEAQFARGLTIAAVVKGRGRVFANSSEVAAATVYGPGIIEIE